MTETIISLLAFVTPIIIEIIRQQREKQTGANHEQNMQDFRKALSAGDINARLADQHDRVQLAIGGSGWRR